MRGFVSRPTTRNAIKNRLAASLFAFVTWSRVIAKILRTMEAVAVGRWWGRLTAFGHLNYHVSENFVLPSLEAVCA